MSPSSHVKTNKCSFDCKSRNFDNMVKMCYLLLTALLTVVFLHGAHGSSWKFRFANPNVCDGNCNDGSTYKSKVAINCKVTGGYLPKGTDCTNPIIGGIEEPFYTAVSSPGESCGTKPINVTLTYKICNENTSGDLVLNPDRTWMSYDGFKIMFPKTNIKPMKCRMKKVKRRWDLCKVNSNKGREQRAWDILINAAHTGGKGHCYCYSFRRSTHYWTNDGYVVPVSDSYDGYVVPESDSFIGSGNDSSSLSSLSASASAAFCHSLGRVVLGIDIVLTTAILFR